MVRRIALLEATARFNGLRAAGFSHDQAQAGRGGQKSSLSPYALLPLCLLMFPGLDEQYGHALPALLLLTDACHSWPLRHIHHTLLLLFDVTSCAVRAPFRVGCHSDARLGMIAAKQLSSHTFLPLQYGHPVP